MSEGDLIKKYLRFYVLFNELEHIINYRYSNKHVKILDIGCGKGEVEKYFRDNKLVEVINVDIVKKDTSLGNFFQIDIENEKLPFEENTFDFIVALEIIEHLNFPEKFLTGLRYFLKKDGNLILTTPNIRFIKYIFNLFLIGIFPNTSSDKTCYDDGHRNFFTLRKIKEISNDYIFEKYIGLTSEKVFKRYGFLRFFIGKRLFYEFFCVGIFVILKK